MIIFNKMINYLLLDVELIVAAGLFINKLEKRRLYGLRLAIVFLLTVLLTYLLILLKDYIMDLVDHSTFTMTYFWSSYLFSVVYNIILFIMFVIMLACVFKTSVFNITFVACATLSVRNIADGLYCIYVGAMNFGETGVVDKFSDWVSILVYIAIYLVVYASSYLLIRTYRAGDEHYLDKRIMAVLILVAACSFIFSGVNIPQNSDQLLLLYIFVQIGMALLCVMGLLVEFYFLRMLKYQAEAMKQEQMLEKQKEQFKVASENITNVNLNAHDLKRQLSVIMKAVQESGQAGSIADELGDIMEAVNAVDTIYKTGNSALDIVLTEKSRICTSKNIKLSTIVDGTGLDFMSELEIYSLFGNAMDNATEATEAVEDPEGRIISFQLKHTQGVILLHVENTYAVEPSFVKGMPQTTKGDKSSHGFGTKSMAQIVRKYGGEMTLKADSGVFYLDAVIPMRASDAKDEKGAKQAGRA